MGDTARLFVSLLPVVVFLWGLRLLDSYKLLTVRRTLWCLLAGAVVAGVCYALNTAIFDVLGPEDDRRYLHFGAPVVEEVLKALYVAWLIRESRVGFMVDAAISGFAVGAGFALVENITYLHHFAGETPMLWILRGFGAAMMHGGNTAIVGIAGSSLAERRGARSLLTYLPGLGIAVALHSIYNQQVFPPTTAAMSMLVGLPIALGLVFLYSEKMLRQWIGERLDQEIDLLNMIRSGSFSETHAGRYLHSLETSFGPEVIGDMLCLLQNSIEVSASVKGGLMMREAGFEAPPDPSLPARIEEMRHLEKRIGAAGRIAMAPLLPRGSRHLWELHQSKAR